MPLPSASQIDESTSLEEASRGLLRAIIRQPDDRSIREIQEWARQIREWDRLLASLGQHRLLPLAFSRLTEGHIAIPPEMFKQLKNAYQQNVFHCTSNALELIAILRAFELEQIRAMPFKGIVLGATLYGDLPKRSAGDIDVLIDLDNLLRATAILLKMGYDLKTPVREDGLPAWSDNYEYHFERRVDGMVVELRWRLELTQPRYRHNIGLQWAWARHKTARLAGEDVPSMDPETTLLVLCMHGSKHIWSRLVWVCDLAYLLARFSSLDWQYITDEARHSGLSRALSLGVLLAHRVCRAEVPKAILRQFEADSVASDLAQSIEENIFDRPGELPKGRVPYNVRLLGFQDRMRLLLSLNFLRPNELDLKFIRLPRRFRVLYLLVRPFRIMRDKSPR
jgi:hypothetical protein